ncbi:hypothetical protein EDD29_4714 [Actinocorallia herbida]|uniref:Uncharacterized protein n=1 Tax=Actinocorallia herbida TaxID=58109 RepID=A0A3N1D0R2_9ACTN|nr:T3SS effector HopA1 family protein [Actinocorallia herbida]ROO87123.1 hypothetical protein EDD29_4714 [Actinocorallia herbida]
MLPQSRKKSRKKTDDTEQDRPVLSRPRNLNTRPDGPAPLPLRLPAPANEGAPPGDPALDVPRFPLLPALPPFAQLPRLPPGTGTGAPPKPPAIGGTRRPPKPLPPTPTRIVPPANPPTVEAPLPLPSALPQIPLPTREEQAAERVVRTAREMIGATNAHTLEEIYDHYYENGFRTRRDEASTIYRRLTADRSLYTAKPISPARFGEFLSIAEQTGIVTSQLVIKAETDLEKWREELAEHERSVFFLKLQKEVDLELTPEQDALLNSPPPAKPRLWATTLTEALSVGDYIRVANKRSSPGLSGALRRIIVNVRSQQIALEVATALSRLFGSSEVSPWLTLYKVFLASADLNEPIKFDKIVVYYAPHDSGDGEDHVGAALVSTISAAIPPGTGLDTFGPFYSPVAPGIAWAEDPSTTPGPLQTLSFSQGRVTAIAAVIRANPHIPTFDHFLTHITTQLQKMNIDPYAPHRHLGPSTGPSPRPSHS